VIENANRILRVTLSDRADVSSARAMHDSLLRAQVGSVDAVELDASKVVKLDMAALQLVVAWLAELDAQHLPWTWQGTSETFQQIAVLAGLAAVLRLKNEQPTT
jgi:anti-anti-sigma regulatory factor